MKKRFCTGILLLILSAFLSKTAYTQNVGLGASVGFNLSSHINDFTYQFQDTELDFAPEFTEGYNARLIYRQIFGRNIRMQFEPTLIQMGGSYNDTFIYNDFEFESQSRTELTYLQAPILLQFTTTPPDRAEFPRPWAETTYHISTGFYGGYLLDATFTGTNSGAPIGIDFENSFTDDVTHHYSPYEAGAIIGGGLEYGLDNKIGIELRALFGLTGFSDNSDQNYDPQNISITFDIYFLF
jgi:hypothetical protein